jgi:hypothetical protein
MSQPQPDPGRLFLGLVRAVARLALPAADQATYLARIGVGDLADELALDFDDHVRLVTTFMDHGWLTQTEVASLQTLDRLLDDISGRANAHLWRGDALATRPEWERIRDQARTFLFA